jgi:serine/threonine-protein kinase
MNQEREERFYSFIQLIESGNDPQAAFDSAVEVFWDRIDPYYSMAKRLWNDGDIDICMEFIELNLGNLAMFQNNTAAARKFGDIYYILGNCYNQSAEPNYHIARGFFEIAVNYVTDNPEYYFTYAVTLARTGDISLAEEVFDQARVLGLKADSLNLLEGEIFFAGRNYESALNSLSKVISQSPDDYLRYRAYLTSDTIFRISGQPEQSVALLTESLNRVPINRIPEMTERLAEAYYRSGDTTNAIILFEQLANEGTPRFHILDGFVILLQNAGEFDRAVSVLSGMADSFPNDFRIPMRRALLEADRQSKITNDSRDYTLTKEYYDYAITLYNENVIPHDSEQEIQSLIMLIEQLQAHGWID